MRLRGVRVVSAPCHKAGDDSVHERRLLFQSPFGQQKAPIHLRKPCGLDPSLQRDAVHKSRGRRDNIPTASASLTLAREVVKPVSAASLACPAKPAHLPSSRRCPRPTSRFRRSSRAGHWPLRKSGKRLGRPFRLGVCWRQGELLSESWVAFSASGLETGLRRLWRSGTWMLADCGFGRNGPQRQVRTTSVR